MATWIKTAACVLALAGTLSGCDDFLSGPELTTDPNRPSEASIDQLYHAMQVTQFSWHEGDLARHVSMWMQQMAGVGNQTTSRDLYNMSEQDLSFWFSGIYLGGGLIDMRDIIARAEAQNDRTYAGITRVWEAFLIGMAASLWGDIPYSEAVGESPTPALDEQAEVYAAVQALLDQAIADLRSATGAGPGALDLVYGGDRQKWIEAAHTLKARFYLHWVEAQNTASTQALASTACGGDCLQQTREAAQSGISAPANNFNSHHTSAPGEENLWYQFMFVQRQGQISAGRFLVDLLKSRGDPRLAEYFAPMGGEVVGSPPGGSQSSLLSATRGAAGFDQPLITYAENQLILAETSYRLGSEGLALTHLNNARAAAGLGNLSGLAGSELLREIMLEKYIALFQNLEVWNDFKRTCVPQLRPASGSEVIGRILYGSAERNVNPNIPHPREQPARNDNDPNPCPAP